jgi:hypothetical protein
MFGFFAILGGLYMKAKSNIRTFLLCVLIPVVLNAKDKYPDFRVIETSDAGLSAFYRPDVSKLQPPKVGRTLNVDLPHHGTALTPDGTPSPFRRHLIALPLGGRAAITINSLKTRVLENVSLPDYEINAETQALAEKDFPHPYEFVSLSAPFRYRRLNVTELTLKPIQYDRITKKLTVLEEISFRVNFIESKDKSKTLPSEENFNDIVLNPHQAKNWNYSPLNSSPPAFPSGLLLKMIVRDDGAYRIGYSDIENLDLSPENFPLDLISLYNNGGRELPTGLASSTPDSMIENALFVFDEDSDNIFDQEDYLIFYGQSVKGWNQIAPDSLIHYINHYTADNIYWLELKTFGAPGKRMSLIDQSGSASTTISTTKARLFREDEKVIYSGNTILLGSGLNWYGDLLTGAMSKSYIHNLPNVASGYYKIRIRIYPISGSPYVKAYWNNNFLGYITNSSIKTYIGDAYTEEGLNTLKLENTNSSSLYLDWYEIEYERELQTDNQNPGGGLFISSPLGAGKALYSTITGLNDSAFVFEVSDFAYVKYFIGNQFKDDLSNSAVKTYFACNYSALKTPESISVYSSPASDYTDLRDISNQGQYLLITHSDFFNGITPLVNLWTAETGLSVNRITTAQIYDQFGWGLYDPVAIRNFLKFAVDNWSQPPEYINLIGDGDYDYFNRMSVSDKNWVPPYEENSKCYDDFYTYLHTQHPELAIGRLTVTSTQELATVIDKITKYTSQPDFSSWRKHFIVVADDEFGPDGASLSEHSHTIQSESLADNYLPDFMDLTKVYLTEYPVVPGAGGRQKPGATEDLISAINEGAMMINYFGHGNEMVWAHEYVLQDERDIPQIDNGYRLSIFSALTCDWGYFDNVERQSTPEQLLVLPGRGAIASIGATRPTSGTQNWGLAQDIYTEIFQNEYNPKSLGEALKLAKLSFSGSNSEKYHIIGDPMITPCTPRNEGEISQMAPDSLFALNLISLQGIIQHQGSPWTNFQGTVDVEVHDSAIPVTYFFQGEPDSDFVNYELPGKSIFQGPISVTGGVFTSYFVVPMDISYNQCLGRISLYFTDGVEDGCGYLDNIYIGSGGIVLMDNDIPTAQIYFGDESYRTGDPVPTSPTIIVNLVDSGGMNLTASPGHEIMLFADDALEFNLTPYFEYELDSHTKGALIHQLDYLAPGSHQMKLRVWDSFNHPCQVEFTLETSEIEEGGDYLSDLLNYPNPFSSETDFTFKILQSAEIEIEIYTVGGRLIKSLGPKTCTPMFVFNQFIWNGRDEEGDKIANGVYIYKVKADFNGEIVTKIGKLIVMR